MKNLKDPIGNWSRDIPGCSAGPQQTAIPRVPTFITNTRLKQTRPRGNEAAKTFAWQIIRCPHAWTKSSVRSVPRQYMEVSGADIGVILWVVTCYLMWIGTRITNTELRLNKTPTWCNKMQILLLQTISTCFGRHAPIIRSIKYWHGSHRYR